MVASDLLSMHFSFYPNFFFQLAHFHARWWYMHIAYAFPLSHHVRAVLAWGP